MREAFIQGRRITVFGRQHVWFLEDGTAEQVKLVDCFIFEDVVLQMGFQSEPYCIDKQSSI